MIGVNLTADPTRTMDLGTALKIMFVGMTRGGFTGKKLGDYFAPGKEDWRNARRIIDGIEHTRITSHPMRGDITPRSATRSDRERIPRRRCCRSASATPIPAATASSSDRVPPTCGMRTRTRPLMHRLRRAAAFGAEEQGVARLESRLRQPDRRRRW